MKHHSTRIPAPYSKAFTNGINHPELYLWDSWSYFEKGTYHLYCLALSRVKEDGAPLLSSDRNDYPFHVRHFTSKDEGKTWKDEGCFIRPQDWEGQSESYTVWSGGIELLPDGTKLAAFTALDKTDAKHPFIQNIGLAVSENGYQIDRGLETKLSAPERDRALILEKGYYLGPQESLGNAEGEEGGPILAWRDPFVFVHPDKRISLLWAAKVSPLKGAVARAEIQKTGDSYAIKELVPAVAMPDGDQFTQLECPKLVYDAYNERYYLLISVCNRVDESQPEAEVGKGVNVYKSSNVDGPWESCGPKILADRNLFGPTVLKTDFKNNRLLCIAPYTEVAGKELGLTFASVFYVYLDPLRVEFL